MASSEKRHGVSSISDIARLAGVSASTVSRALAGSTMISLETRARINALAREHGFQLNQMARNLRLKRTNAIGIVFPFGQPMSQLVSDPFFVAMLGHVADSVTARGYDLLLTRIVPDDDGWLDVLVNSGRVDGVIVIGPSDQDVVLRRVASSYGPIVAWSERKPDQGYCSVGTDNGAGGVIATRHLLAGGRRRILYAGDPAAPEIRARYEGFLAAHREAGTEPGGMIPAPATPGGAYELFVEHLAEHPAPDGIVAASDVIAVAAIRALAGRGLSVPGEVAVIGYDDVPLAAQVVPSLSTVRQNLREGAEQLVERLFRRLDGEPCDPIVMKPELVLRASAP